MYKLFCHIHKSLNQTAFTVSSRWLFFFVLFFSFIYSSTAQIIDSLAGFDEQHVLQHLVKQQQVPADQVAGYVNLAKQRFIAEKFSISSKAPNGGEVVQSACSNLDFEAGNTSGWTLSGDYKVVSTGNDWYGGFPKSCPGGNFSLRLGSDTTINYSSATKPVTSVAQQTFAVSKANSLLTINYAMVLLNYASHTTYDAGRVLIEVFDKNNKLIVCATDTIYAISGTKGLQTSTRAKICNWGGECSYNVLYKPWTPTILDLGPYMGTNVTLRITNQWCLYGPDWAYSFIDCSCSPLQITKVGDPCSGSVDLCGPNGALGYTWSGPGGVGGQTSKCVTTTASGKYTVQLPAAGGCPGPKIDTVISITNSILSSGMDPPKNLSCFNSNDGEASVKSNGGSANYTYSWSNGTTVVNNSLSNKITGLSSNTYSVTITDAIGCTSQTQVTLTQPSEVLPNGVTGNSTCNGSNDGVVVSWGGGGSGNYTYLWQPDGQTTSSIYNLQPGTYSVTITDDNGCVTSSVFSTTEPPVITGTASTTDATCTVNNGTLTAAASGGSGSGYIYSLDGVTWIPSGNFTNLSAGFYIIHIQDGKGCWGAITATINNAAGLTATTISKTNVLCNGDSNGALEVAGSAGTAPYEYSIDNGVSYQNNGLFTNLPAGNYNILIKDMGGCAVVQAVNITEPTPITANITTVDAACGNINGSIQAVGAGGAGGYTYALNGAPYQAGNYFTVLASTTYSVTIKDVNGCTISTTAIVGSVSGPTVTLASSTNPKCNGVDDGKASVSTTGGTQGYTYSWSGGIVNNTSSLTNLAAAAYSVTVIDARGCTSSTDVTITTPPALVPTVSSTPASCATNNGTLNVSATGGTPGISYSWSNGPSAPTVTGVAPATYTVTLTDNNSCTISTTVTVSNIISPVVTTDVLTNVTCDQGNDGSISATVTGGQLSYSYSWGGGIAANTSTLDGLSAGTYSVTVIDAGGCQSASTVTITAPPAIVPVTGTVAATCGASNGVATASASGGVAGYSYSWSNGPSSQTVNGLSSAIYSVTVMDSKGCTISTTANVSNSSGPTLSYSKTPVTCNAGSNGTATVSISGGSGPMSISWSNGTTGLTGVTGLTANTYSVSVTDNNGCTVTQSIVITEAPKLTLLATGLATRCVGSCDGQGVVIPGGGTNPYTVAWSGGGSGLSINNLCVGTYSITITDVAGCTKDSSIAIGQPTAIVLSTSAQPSNCGLAQGSASVTSVSGGSPGYSYSWSDLVGATGVTASNLSSGSYTVTVKDLNGCTQTASAIITNNNGVTASMQTPVSVKCAGSCDGSVAVLGIGGSLPYNYLWGSGATAQTAANLCKGTYTVTVKDNNNCTSTAIATIVEPAPLLLAANIVAPICIGQSAVLAATPSGGTPAYTLAWLPSGPTVNPIVTSTYTVSVVDGNGCTTTAQTIAVPVNPPLTISGVAPPPVCPGASATLSTAALGGNSTYTYSWQPSGTSGSSSSINVSVTKPLTYTVIVTDACGTPAASTTLAVSLNPLPVVSFSMNKTAGCAPVCVNFLDKTSGVVGKWLWDLGGIVDTTSNPSHCFTTAGKYAIKLRVFSDKGCLATDTATTIVNVYPSPVAEYSTSPEIITVLDPTVSFTDLSTDAVSWLWEFGDSIDSKTSSQQNPVHTFQNEGTYCSTLKIVSANGCKDTIEHCITVGSDFTFFVPDAFSPNNDGKNELFTGKGIGIKTYKMLVFDRWGNLIYQTEDLNRGWDGKANGGRDIAQQDIYVYRIIIEDIYNRHHNYMGHISLVR